MKKASAWIENNRYVECPYCGEVLNLGDQSVLEDYEDNCYICDEKFLVGKET